MGDRKRDKEAG